jgi:serine phosphatase RsbU (regulator of sigma subunit)
MKDKIIKELEKKLILKDQEINNLYNLINKLNSSITNLLSRTNQSIANANLINRRFSIKKLPNIKDIKFTSKFIMSQKDNSSYFEFFEAGKFAFVLVDSEGYQKASSTITKINEMIESKEFSSSKEIVGKLLSENTAITALMISKKGLVMDLSSHYMPDVLILRDEIIHVSNTEFKLLPGDKVLIFNNFFFKVENNNIKISYDKVLEIINKHKKLPVSDIVTEITFYLESFTNNKRELLYGDIAIIGVELEKKMMYVI